MPRRITGETFSSAGSPPTCLPSLPVGSDGVSSCVMPFVCAYLTKAEAKESLSYRVLGAFFMRGATWECGGGPRIGSEAMVVSVPSRFPIGQQHVALRGGVVEGDSEQLLVHQQAALCSTAPGCCCCQHGFLSPLVPCRFGPAGDPRGAGIGTKEAIQLVWSCHREIIEDVGPVPASHPMIQS